MKAPEHPCMTEDEIRAYARSPGLAFSQAVAIIQGFKHYGRSGDGIQYTDLYAEDVEAIRSALNDGRLCRPIAPRALVEFSNNSIVRLPKQFIDEVVKRTPRSSRIRLTITPTDELVLPPRKSGRPIKDEYARYAAPQNKDDGTVETKSRRRFRSIRIQGRETDIEQAARDIALAVIRSTGRVPGKKTIAAKLSIRTGRKSADLLRRFSKVTLLLRADVDAARRSYRDKLRQESIQAEK